MQNSHKEKRYLKNTGMSFLFMELLKQTQGDNLGRECRDVGRLRRSGTKGLSWLGFPLLKASNSFGIQKTIARCS